MSEPISYTVEFLRDIDLLRQCVDLQRKAWGFADEDLLPLRMLVVCTKIGGQVFGALDPNRKVLGFLNAFPGLRDGKIYLHSQMMGVLPEFQNLGIGKKLKLKQRDEAMSRGIQRVEWTFDPLETRNARFNLEILGAICRRFYVNTYGITSSHLQGGLPTDRLLAEWHLGSARVRSRLSHNLGYSTPIPLSATVELPSNIRELKLKDPQTAFKLQLEFREKILNLLDKDYCVTKFEVDPDCQKVRYYLQPFNEHLLEP